MTKNRWVVLAAVGGALAAIPAQAGTVSATMTVSVIVVAPGTPRRAGPDRAQDARTEAAEAPVAVVEDAAARTRIIVY
jgi:hypothetical protein